MTDSSSVKQPRWYEWLLLPVAVVVGIVAAIVLAIVGPVAMGWRTWRVRRRWQRIYKRETVLVPFSPRDRAWFCALAIMAVAWWVDHRSVERQLQRSDRDVVDFQAELNHLEHLAEDLQKQVTSQRDTIRHAVTDDELRHRLDARRRTRHNASEPANSAILRSDEVSHAVHAGDSNTY
jgi:hypothetical protein